VLYGSLGGNLFVRAYERGEQVYAAMLARGYTGTLPAPGPLFWRGADSLFVGVGVAFALAILFYP
jgi:cobalt/nickel transport system permease protein